MTSYNQQTENLAKLVIALNEAVPHKYDHSQFGTCAIGVACSRTELFPELANQVHSGFVLQVAEEYFGYDSFDKVFSAFAQHNGVYVTRLVAGAEQLNATKANLANYIKWRERCKSDLHRHAEALNTDAK